MNRLLISLPVLYHNVLAQFTFVLVLRGQQGDAGLPPNELLELGVPHQTPRLARIAVLDYSKKF